MREFPWPEMKSEQRPNKTLRSILDYLHWISGELLTPGFYSGSIRMHWARQVEKAYRAMFIPMMVGHGDPYPPAVPAAISPGTWPDFPSASIPGMTLRHQVAVLHRTFEDLRDRTSPLLRPRHVREWDRRLSLAYEALWHGEAHVMPEDARTETEDLAVAYAREVNANAKAVAAKRAAAMRRSMSGPPPGTSTRAPKKPAPPKAAPLPKKAARKKKTAKKPAVKKSAAKKKAVKKKAASATKNVAKKKAAKKRAASKGAKKKAKKTKATKTKATKRKATKTEAAKRKTKTRR